MLPIFVINLDRSEGRLKKASTQLDNLGIKFERISAVDGRAISREELYKHYCIEQNKQKYHRALTPGEIACYLSHRKAWQQIVERALPAAIILEDDFLIESGLENILALVASNRKFDYVKLANQLGRPRKTKVLEMVGSGELVAFKKVPAQTCAQLVSLNGAKRLLEFSDRFYRPIDVDLQHWWEINIEIIGLQPFPFSHTHDIKSDICDTSKRNLQKKRRLNRIFQQISFKINNSIKPKKRY
uniref:glycosyltransferase family 25 protein n=1 Tax=Ningiella ruwaisensis TaxID=2364274 RepID=UPI00109FCC5E|nr:glycosyltransferase family 25 protein [Ningiella ruwaisensis]